MFGRKPKTRNKDKRLIQEHNRVISFCEGSQYASYEVLEMNKMKIPTGYKITFKGLTSIVGIDENQNPEFGDQHIVQIILPPGYPNAGFPPKCDVLSPIWHPNIRSHDPGKGHICLNFKNRTAAQGMGSLLVQIQDILQWRNYHADETVPPYPEDLTVAKWVKEFAEPRGIVNRTDGISESYLIKQKEQGKEKQETNSKITFTLINEDSAPAKEAIQPVEEKSDGFGFKIIN